MMLRGLDVITFLGLGGLFTAHITGNLVVLAAHFAAGTAAGLSAMLSVPVFMLVLGMTGVLAEALKKRQRNSLRPLLMLQFLFLVALFMLVTANGFNVDVTSATVTAGGMLGVSAMAVQNALVQLSLKGAPPTAVMTTNIVRFTMDIVAIVSRDDPEATTEALVRANATWPSIVGFAVGCALGAVCEMRFNLLSLGLPMSFSLVALAAAGGGRRLLAVKA